MQQLEEIVNFYLTSDTNYALMITGDWGVGKTYYFKISLNKKMLKPQLLTTIQKNTSLYWYHYLD